MWSQWALIQRVFVMFLFLFKRYAYSIVSFGWKMFFSSNVDYITHRRYRYQYLHDKIMVNDCNWAILMQKNTDNHPCGNDPVRRHHMHDEFAEPSPTVHDMRPRPLITKRQAVILIVRMTASLWNVPRRWDKFQSYKITWITLNPYLAALILRKIYR